MIISSKTKEYELVFENRKDFIKDLAQIENRIVVVDENVYNIYKDLFIDNFSSGEVIIVEAIENNKTVEVALSICDKIAKLSSKKNTTLISFGGGIIQDLTGFVASIMYRGLKWIFVPTTLLAQTDSCIGGKTSINFEGYKNLLGTFFPPNKILIDLDFVKTLSEDDYRSGLGEVVKFNILAGKSGLDLVKKQLKELLSRDTVILDAFVKRSLAFKKNYIEEDEFDENIRKHLNYAHTFGHAFEKASEFAIPHGQAVLLGTIMANEISYKRKILGESLKKDIEKICIEVLSVKIDASWLDGELFLSAIKNDKKRIGSGLAAVLFDEKFAINVVHDLTASEINGAIDYMIGTLFR